MVSFIVLSQLNRGIEDKDRVTNPSLHYPTKNDIFAASSVYYSSDYVWMIHCPSNIPGIKYYGMPLKGFPSGLPIYMETVKDGKKKNRKVVYIHCIKNRFGTANTVVPFLEEFEYSRINQVNLISDVAYENCNET